MRFLEKALRFLGIPKKPALSRESAVTKSATDTALFRVSVAYIYRLSYTCDAAYITCSWRSCLLEQMGDVCGDGEAAGHASGAAYMQYGARSLHATSTVTLMQHKFKCNFISCMVSAVPDDTYKE